MTDSTPPSARSMIRKSESMRYPPSSRHDSSNGARPLKHGGDMLGRRVFSASGGLVAQSAYILFKDASLGLRAKTRPAHETQDAAASRDTAAHISRACTVVSSRIRDDVHLAGV